MRQLLAFVAFVAGCAGSAHQEPAPTQCKRSDRHGVYLFEFTTVSGNCGTFPASLVNLDTPPASGCVTSGVTWSNGDCKLAGSVKCAADAKSPASDATIVTTQQTQDGSVLTGIETISLDGSASCYGTYNIRATRQ